MRLLRNLVVSLLFSVVPARATIYFVDPATGNNANAGTSIGAAWRNPPGTRTTTNSGFISATWGAISTIARIQCGDLILLKGSSTQTSTQGGAWRLDSNYYTPSCTAASPITVTIATNAQWSGSSGNFIINGTGITGTSGLSSSFFAIIDIEQLSGIVLGGNGSSQQLELSSATSNGLFAFCSLDHAVRCPSLKIQFMSIHDSSGAGLEHGGLSNSVLDHLTVFNNGAVGFGGGVQADWANTTTGITNSEAYNNGLTDTGNYGDGIELQAPDSEWIVNSLVHDNNERGINYGVITNGEIGHPTKLRIRNLQAYFNGLRFSENGSGQFCSGLHTPVYCCTGSGTNNCIFGNGAGIDASGDNNLTGSDVELYVTRAIFWRNLQFGTSGYQALRSDIWHATYFGNGWNQKNIDVIYDRTGGLVHWHNSIFPKRSFNSTFTSNISSSPINDIKPLSNNNLYVPGSQGNIEQFSTFWFNGLTFTGATRTYADPLGFTGASDKIGSAFTVNFTAVGGTCDSQTLAPSGTAYATCDFHLQGGSSAIDAGGCLFSANGGGNSATTVTVSPNGISSDPRDYFIEPASYLGATGDIIRIGASSVTITSMTGSTINFTPAISWANGACIHLPYNGSSPDMGFFESGAVTTTTTSTSTSVPTTTSTSTSLTTTTSASTTSSTSTSSTSTTSSTLAFSNACFGCSMEGCALY